MEKDFVGYRASFIQKLFKNWSHGTFYNRLKMLGIKDNDKYMIKNDLSGTVLYNKEGIRLLAEQYAKEFSQNMTSDEIEKKIDDFLKHYLSSAGNSNEKKVFETLKKEKVDNFENVDCVEKQTQKEKDVNVVKDSDFNEKYILRIEHNAIVENLKAEIVYLKKNLETEKAEKKELTEIIKVREQRDIIIEQQKLEKLIENNNSIKLIGENEEHSRKGLFTRIKDIFSKK